MPILIRSRTGKWENAALKTFAQEAELQALLYNSPEIIVREDDAMAVFIREAGLPGSGYTDLLGVDTNGEITIIETKLAKNDEIRRKVIGQVLEYAAHLWGMSYDDLDAFFVQREQQSLFDLLASVDPSIVHEEFRAKVAENLSQGSFRLVIAVDEMNADLEKIIAYVSSVSKGLRLEALELHMYAHGETEILVPERYGQISATASPAPRSRVTLEHIQSRSPDAHSRALLSLLWSRWTQRESDGFRIAPGTSGASFKAAVGGAEKPVFWVFSDSIQCAYKMLANRDAPPDLLSTYRVAVSKIAGFDPQRNITADMPTAMFSNLTSESVNQFTDESVRFITMWRERASKRNDK